MVSKESKLLFWKQNSSRVIELQLQAAPKHFFFTFPRARLWKHPRSRTFFPVSIAKTTQPRKNKTKENKEVKTGARKTHETTHRTMTAIEHTSSRAVCAAYTTWWRHSSFYVLPCVAAGERYFASGWYQAPTVASTDCSSIHFCPIPRAGKRPLKNLCLSDQLTITSTITTELRKSG